MFKLSNRQRHLLERCAQYENTTPTKFIKHAISMKMEPHLGRIAEEDANPLSENQLELFDFSKVGAQISMWEKAG